MERSPKRAPSAGWGLENQGTRAHKEAEIPGEKGQEVRKEKGEEHA